MATSKDIQVYQKTTLTMLLSLKKTNDKAGIKVLELEETIIQFKAQMDAEDVAYVEKTLAELDKM
jgi:hypothetical protein